MADSTIDQTENKTLKVLMKEDAMAQCISKLPLNEVMMFALTNIKNTSTEGGYAVHHSNAPVSDFGMPHPGESHGSCHVNPLAAPFPLLFLYGIGGIEEEQKNPGILTMADLKQAEKKEANKLPISNPCVRLFMKHVFASSGRVMGSDPSCAAYQGKIWGSCLTLRGPAAWLTINPCDLHDPIAQVLVGEEINMNAFNSIYFACAQFFLSFVPSPSPVVSCLNGHSLSMTVATPA
ncbi:uncharacterized protein F5147DRAFT_769999 [Suillus discolor]|uniref:Helitron helicase-like domain-containing protein n=1 Tax=Suillus discolor TaxID=1912936 RepID=A0A9P7FE01_9AGAM|nr:uncharacterized protein F5147DRAFT_769999 [Suillus discolor]KAG2114679.1 hypothetical protein F5147DRAFT_769999 [Suillus discolor]